VTVSSRHFGDAHNAVDPSVIGVMFSDIAASAWTVRLRHLSDASSVVGRSVSGQDYQDAA